MKRIILIVNIIFLCISLFAQTDEEIITQIKNGVYAEKEGDLQNAILISNSPKKVWKK